MKRIAAFDFDGTITTKDTFVEFIRFVHGSNKLYGGFLLFSPLLVLSYMKMYPKWRVKQIIFSFFFKGMSLKKFNNLSLDFADELNEMVFTDALDGIKDHQKNNTEVIVISASIENWIEPFMKSLGVQTVIATKINVDDNGCIEGTFLTPNCKGKEKVKRLLDVLPDRNNYELVAYGDSSGDKELLAFADIAHFRKFTE